MHHGIFIHTTCLPVNMLRAPSKAQRKQTKTKDAQVALTVIMAQIGSFVPAKFACVRVVDKLFTRIGTSDSIETNSSSFMVEMQETAHIVNHASERYAVLSFVAAGTRTELAKSISPGIKVGTSATEGRLS